MRMHCRCLAVVLAVLGLLQTTLGTAEEWIDPLGGNFVDPDNWSFGIVPDEFEDANYLLPNDYTVTFPTLAFSATVSVRNGNVVFDVPGDPGMGIYEIDALLVGEGGIPMVDPPLASLTINGGRVQADTVVEVYAGATLDGNGELFSFGPTIFPGGRLTGTLNVIGSTTFNQGVVAPGNGAGVLTLNSDYFQSSEGTLEIEVGGTTPGLLHDQLVVSNSAQLMGELHVSFISGYVPNTMHSLTLLTANSITGQFDSLSFPDLGASGLAVQVNYTPTGIVLSYANPISVAFNSGVLAPPPAPPNNYWNTPGFWGGGSVPDSTSVVSLFNSQVGPRVIELSSQIEGADRAFVHQITIGGSSNTMTLLLPEETDFTAVKTMTVGDQGVLRLAGGTVHSNQVVVNPGGLIRGNGTIEGSVELGTNTGSLPATLSPGFSPGEIVIEGDLTIEQNGVLEIEIDDANTFDRVSVTQSAALGGKVTVDVTGVDITSIENASFQILTADDVDMTFAEVETMGAPDYFFAPEYTEIAVIMSLFEEGDMERDFDLDSADVTAFAMALKDPDLYADMYGITGDASGDIDDNGMLDFDDIEPFANIHGIGLTAEEVLAVIADYGQVPEPASFCLILVALAQIVLKRPGDLA